MKCYCCRTVGNIHPPCSRPECSNSIQREVLEPRRVAHRGCPIRWLTFLVVVDIGMRVWL